MCGQQLTESLNPLLVDTSGKNRQPRDVDKRARHPLKATFLMCCSFPRSYKMFNPLKLTPSFLADTNLQFLVFLKGQFFIRCGAIRLALSGL